MKTFWTIWDEGTAFFGREPGPLSDDHATSQTVACRPHAARIPTIHVGNQELVLPSEDYFFFDTAVAFSRLDILPTTFPCRENWVEAL